MNRSSNNDRPNVVLVVLDSVRRDHLSCYGYTRRTTPNIDRIAEEGVRYTRGSATSCWTLPSHASIFTGLYPSDHRMELGDRILNPSLPTIAEFLSGQGYRTASISCNGFISDHTNLTKGFELTVDADRLLGGNDRFARRAIRAVHRRWKRLSASDRGARRATRRAKDWLRARTKDGQPFFVFLNYMDCHQPYRLKGEDRYRFLRPEQQALADAVPQDPFGMMAGELELTAEDVELLKALYDGCLFHLDRHIGELERHLRDLRLTERTVLIITSDHGESFGEHGLMDHQFGLYENLIGVPLIVRGPSHLGSGTDERLVQHVDLFPTIVDLVGDESAEWNRLPGHSLLAAAQRDASYAEYLVPNLQSIRRRFPHAAVGPFERAIRSISTGREKLIWRDDESLELYRLDTDPQETTDLSSRRRDRSLALRQRCLDFLGPWPSDEDQEAAYAEGPLQERLEALGYL